MCAGGSAGLPLSATSACGGALAGDALSVRASCDNKKAVVRLLQRLFAASEIPGGFALGKETVDIKLRGRLI